MAEPTTVARPYAEAAFALAREANALSGWADALALLAGLVREPKVAAAIDDPKLALEQKYAIFATLAGDRMPAAVQNFLRVLLEADRVKLLPHIEEQFQALKRDAEGVTRATIVSAYPLTEAQREEFRAALARRYGRSIELIEEIDHSLLGGARICVGDEVIDRSVTGQLAKMERHLKA
ncbi:MAG: F0F1 ATP synthase subunit delta [Casimicrobiaceae bacterium]|nr:F0F1 ATP synthase subunit delta [Casimicrobiaceae bacterium]